MFALSAIDPKLGRYEARQYTNDDWTDIEMIDCKTLLPDPSNETEGFIGNTTFNPYHSEAAKTAEQRPRNLKKADRRYDTRNLRSLMSEEVESGDKDSANDTIKYFCPLADQMVLQGSDVSETLKYVTISFMGCDQSTLPEGDECESYEKVNNKALKFEGLQNFVDFAAPAP